MNSIPSSSASLPAAGSSPAGNLPNARLGRRFQLIPPLLLIAGLIITGLLVAQQDQIAKDATRARFEREVERTQSEIDKRVTTYENLLRSAAGFLSAYISDRPIDRLEWRQYVATLDLERRYPGISGLGFVAVVPGSQLESFELATRAEGLPLFEVRPAGVRPDYYPIKIIEPFERNDTALGFDLYVDSASQEAANRARDIGQAIITRKLPLAPSTDNPHQASFLMLMPVYHSLFAPQNQDERRTKIIGWVYAPFDAQLMLKGVLENAANEIALEIYDGVEPTPQQLLFDSRVAATHQSQPLFMRQAPAEVNGRSWLRVFRTLPPLEQSTDYTAYWLFLVGGSLGSLMVATLGLVLLNTAQIARGQAERMTASLRESEERFRLITENAADLISIIDTRGRRIYSSPSYQRVMGYKPAELERTNAFELIHPEDRSYVQSITYDVSRLGVDHTLEYRMKRVTDGAWRTIESTITAIRTPEGKVNRLVLVARDVTERKNAAEAQRQQNLFLTALYETTLSLMNRREMEDVLQSIVSRAAALANTPHGYLFQLEAGTAPETSEMVMKVGTGFFAQRVGDRIKRGQSVAGLAWQSGEAQVVNNYATWSGRVPHPVFDQLRTLVAVPLKISSEVIGVIGLGQLETERVFSEAEVTQLTQFAQLAALAFDNARLFAAAQQELADRQRAEQTLRESEARYRQLIDNANDIVYRINSDGTFIYISPVAERIVGYTPAELLGSNYLQLIRPDQREAVATFYLRQFTENQPSTYYEFPVVTKDGREIWIGQNVQAIFEGGRITEFQAVARDVTLLKQTEDELRRARDELEIRVQQRTAELQASEEKYRTTLENIEEGVYELDLVGRFTFFNHSILRIYGYSQEETLGLHYKQYTTPEDVDKVFKAYNQVYRTGIPAHGIEHRAFRKDGAPLYLETSASLIRDLTGAPSGFRGVVRDITARKQAEAALRESEEKYRTILENLEDGYYEIDLAGRLEFFNDAGLKILGLAAREAALGIDMSQSIAPEYQARVSEAFRQVLGTGKSVRGVEYQIVRPDGTRRFVEASISLRHDTGGNAQGFRSVVRDVTERREAESEIRHIITGTRALFWHALVVAREETFEWDTRISNEDTAREFFPVAMQPGQSYSDAWYRSKLSEDLARMEALSFDALRTGKRHYSQEFRIRLANAEIRWLYEDTQIEPLGIGRWRIVGVCTDITERKRAEELLLGQTRIFEAIAKDAPRNDLLARIALFAESQSPGALCAVTLVSADGKQLHSGVGPSLPPSFIQALEGIPTGPRAGSCGTAVYRREQIITADIGSDPLWDDYREWMINQQGLRACWSTPIISLQGQVFGTFAMYFREPRQPTAHDLSLMAVATQLAGIVFERKQAEEALRQSQERFSKAFVGAPVAISINRMSDARFLEANERYTELLGYTSTELIGHTEPEFNLWVTPGERERMYDLLKQGGQVRDFETQFRTKTGEVRDTLFSAESFELGGEPHLLAMILDISERKRAERQARQQAIYLNALNETALGLIGRLDVGALLEDIINRAADLLDAPDGYLYLLEPDGQTMQMRVGTGTQKALIGARIHRGEGVTGRVWLSGEPLIVNDYRHWSGRMAGSAYDLRQAVIGVPLTAARVAGGMQPEDGTTHAETQVVGVIGLSHTTEGKVFDENAVVALTRFAQLASVALDNARLFEQTQQRVAELATVNSINQVLSTELDLTSLIKMIVGKIYEYMGVTQAYIALYDAQTNTYEIPHIISEDGILSVPPRPLQSGLTAEVVRTRQPLLINRDLLAYADKLGSPHIRANPPGKCYLGVPLLTREQVIGVIALLDSRREGMFGEREVRLLTTIAPGVSIALQNARLFAQAQQRASELAAVNEIARAISEHTNPSQLLETLHENLKRLMSADVFYVGVYDRQTGLTTAPYFWDAGNRYDYPPTDLPPEHWLRAQIASNRPQMNNYTAEEVARRHAAKTGEALLAGDVSKTFASSIHVPFRVGEQFDAVIAVLSYELNAYTQHHLELVSALSSHVAVALTNARLFAQAQSTLAQLQRQAQREQTLSAITDRLHKATDMRTVMRVAAEELRKATGSQRAIVRVQRAKPNGPTNGQDTATELQPASRLSLKEGGSEGTVGNGKEA